MTKTEKINKLQDIAKKLKADFIGIDEIIDRVIENITPWYVTPEILERPVVLSLWGLTGTGKTSLVRKLVEYLDLLPKTIFFDCGEIANPQGESFTETLNNHLSDDCRSTVATSDDGLEMSDYVFVLDEFQYARTIDQEGNEKDQPTTRSIWNLIDSGIIDINSTPGYDVNRLYSLLAELRGYSKLHPGIKILKGGLWKKSDQESDAFKNTIGLLYSELKYDLVDYSDDEDEEKSKTHEQLVIPSSSRMTLMQKLNKVQYGLGYTAIKEILSTTTLSECVDVFKKYVDELKKPQIINASQSLIFILGNLDEAFGISSDFDPDVSADVFHDITSAIGINDLKEALHQKFRPEQVGRLGNNLIKYPSLRTKDFEKIIEKELTRIHDRFLEISGYDLKYGKGLKKLLYSEGVFPVQGVRPVITSIGSILSPRLSTILIEAPENTKSVEINTYGKNFDKSQARLVIKFFDKADKIVKTKRLSIKLSLGELRDTTDFEKLMIHSVHEASHAVVYSKLTGEIPRALVALSSMGGGYMWDEVNRESKKAAESREELDNNVCVSLAGWIGEHHFWPPEKCSLGAGSDISNSFTEFQDAAYKSGYFAPFEFVQSEYNPNMPSSGLAGITDNLDITQDLPGQSVKALMWNRFRELRDQTTKLISKEEELIKEIAKYLAKNRSMSSTSYKRYIKTYAKTFNLGSMKKNKETAKTYYTKTIVGE